MKTKLITIALVLWAGVALCATENQMIVYDADGIPTAVSAINEISIGATAPSSGVFTTLLADSLDLSPPSSGDTGEVSMFEDPDNGSDLLILKAPASMSEDVTITYPNTDGENGQTFTTDGTGTLSWVYLSCPEGVFTSFASMSDGDCVRSTTTGDLYVKTTTGGFQHAGLYIAD